MGTNAPTTPIDRWWSCYARIGYQEEDKAEAARLAGVVLNERDCVMIGVMSAANPCHWPIPAMEAWNVRN